MAKNRIFANARYLNLEASTADAPATSNFQSGKPIMIGRIPGVALTDMASDRKVTIDTGGAYRLTVTRVTTATVGIGTAMHWNTTARKLHVGTTVAGFTTTNRVFGVLLTSVPSGTTGSSTGHTIKIGPAIAGA